MELMEMLSAELSLPQKQVEAAVQLLDEGNTVPFIARYRKEVTGGLDDTALRNLAERLTYLRNLDARKKEVSELIGALDKLTPEITAAIEAAATLTAVEDIYRPFRPKRRTRASVAKERGLEPLAMAILEQKKFYNPILELLAESFVNPEKEVHTAEEALAGAMDILAEQFAEDTECRGAVRDFTRQKGLLVCKQNPDKDLPVYAGYYDYSEPVRTIPGHRILAINRGEREEALKVSLTVDVEAVLRILREKIVKNPKSPAAEKILSAMEDGYDRLMAPSIEREIRSELTDTASEGAIQNFSMNLRNLLLSAPLKGKTVLGFDPGYRTGCKLAVVDPTGAVLETAVIYPTKPHEKVEESRKKVLALVKKYGVNVVAIGNGTASGESEMFIADTIGGSEVRYSIVSEAGASVYSASELGAEEFPDFDVTERSAVSIARRLQDPLAELVKIDPKSIGVGQYQHDMKPARLDEALSGVVEDCVNAVGVDLNTASPSLLGYIAGIGASQAKKIVKYREENGAFATREAVLKVPRFGAKAYQQAAGFLRVPGSPVPFDNTGVHPESYGAAKACLQILGCTEDTGALAGLRKKAEAYGLEKLAKEAGCGVPTLSDILTELEKPGRDIRDSLPTPVLREKVLTMEELTEGQIFTGTVRNVVDFGAFVDIGVHEDGLVHVSEIADRFIKHPSQVLSVGDVVQVAIKSVDLRRGRIALTMKGVPGNSI